MANLVPVPLTADHAWDLAPRLRAADLADLTIHGSNPNKALLAAIDMPGEPYAILDDGVVIGAGGWTKAGSVWTLWQDLSVGQAKALLKWCPAWARIMAIRSGRPFGWAIK